MKNTFKKIFFIGILLLTTFGVSAQEKSAVGLDKVFNPSRVEETTYKLLMYQQKKEETSDIAIVERTITKENFNSQPCLKITEINITTSPKTKTVIFIDAKTLKPLYFESINDGVLIQKATITNNKIIIADIVNGSEKLTEIPISSNSYLSNSFSELVQSNNFGKNPFISFETFSPNKPANRFEVEKVGEQKFALPGGKKVECWVLKFMRTDSTDVKSLAGYRYVDKISGKVLMFKSDINTDVFFTYQIIFFRV